MEIEGFVVKLVSILICDLRDPRWGEVPVEVQEALDVLRVSIEQLLKLVDPSALSWGRR